MITNQGPTRTPSSVHWVLDHDAAQELAQILCLLEDFLRQASHEAVNELADQSPVRPCDPSRWADRIADYLGDQVIALHTATSGPPPPTAAATSLTGDPR